MSNHIATSYEADFPVLGHLTHLNHAGVAPISGPASAALREYADRAATHGVFETKWYSRVREIKEAAARLIGATSAKEIAFIPNTSTGLSMVAGGIDWQRGDNVVVTNVEYPANRYPWEDLYRKGVELIEIQQQPDGRIDVEDVVEAITNRTRIVAISHVQYASGFRIDLKPISDMVHRAGGYLCVDAIQSVGVLPVDVQAMGIDFLSADGHKWMLGPEGAGILYVREELISQMHPSIVGWMNMVNCTDYGNYRFEFAPTARRFEPGTYNIPGILALGASIDLLLAVGIETIWRNVKTLTDRLADGVAKKGYRLFSPRDVESECSGIVTFDPPYPDTRVTPAVSKITAELGKRGIWIVEREGRLRASPHFYNTIEQVDAVVEALP